MPLDSVWMAVIFSVSSASVTWRADGMALRALVVGGPGDLEQATGVLHAVTCELPPPR